jgi:hypothetical protein
MKIGKLHKKSCVLKILLGLAVAGALLFAACQNIFDMAEQKPEGGGYGYVKVDVDLGEARTLRPDLGQITKYTYKFTGVDVTNVVDIAYDSDTPNPGAFRLPEGKYTIEVEAYTGPANTGPFALAAIGKYSVGNGQFEISVSVPTTISVVLTPKVSAPGTLAIRIKLPANNPNDTTNDNTTVRLPDGSDGFTYEIKQLLAGGTIGAPTPGISLTATDSTSPAAPGAYGGYVTYARGTIGTGTSTPAGTYLITGRINTNNAKYGGFSEVIHVYENMYTEFDKDYTVLDTLASITSAQEAYDILTDEITKWIKNTGVNTGKDPLTASGGKDLTTAGTIRLNYVKSRTDLSGSPAVNFPIVLQGGWQPDTTGFPAASSWNVGDSSAVTTVNLINNSVKANGGLSAAPTYIVELWPVAEYTVSFGSTVTNKAGRSVTVTDIGGPGSKGPIVIDEQNPTRSGIGLVGATDITIVRAAITIGVDGAKAAFAAPDAQNVYTLPAESRAYVINVYETVNEQAESAFTRLRNEIATLWVEQKDALTRSEGPQFSSSMATGLPEYYGGADTVTLSYVVTRLDPTAAHVAAGHTFYIDVPNSVASPNPDDRWEYNGLWATDVGADTVTNDAEATAANAGDSKIIYYRPYGGEQIPYTVKWVPVAEVYVSFVEKDVEVITPPVYPTSSSVTIKDNATSGGTSITYKVDDNEGPFGDYDVYTGKKYKLGTTTITQADVTITIDFTVEAPDGEDVAPPAVTLFDFFTKANPGGPKQYAAASLPAIADIAQTETTGFGFLATSREFHVKVYRSIADQIKAAQAEIREETDVSLWFDDTNTITPPFVETVYDGGLKATSTVADIQSNLTFAGKEPTFKIRNDYVGPSVVGGVVTPASGKNFLAKGWSADFVQTQAAATPDATHGSKTLLLKFTPKGAVEISSAATPYSGVDGVYKIKLQPALLYKINYQKFPIGNEFATGNIKVAGAEPGAATAITPARDPYIGSSGTNGRPAYEFIGVGSAITVTADTAPADKINVIKNRGDATPATNTSTAAGVLTIAAPAAAAMAIAANVEPINIDVYPSIIDQQNNFLNNMRRVSRTSLIDWMSGLTLATSIKDDLPAGQSTQPNNVNATAFQIVGNLAASGGLQVAKPGNNYYFENNTGANTAITAGYLALAIDNTKDTTKIGNGNKSVEIRFIPNGTLAASNADERAYLFNLTAVAQYNIVMMNGPTGATSYGVDLKINTYKPGTDGKGIVNATTPAITDADAYEIPFNQGTPVTTYYGSIGTFAAKGTATATDTYAGPPTIVAASGNVFATDDGAQNTFVLVSGSTFTHGNAAGTPNPITSRVYTIRVYPTVADQTAQVRTKLNNLAGTSASAWVTNKATATTAGATLIGPVTSPTTAGPGNFRAGTTTGDVNTLEFQYWGDNPTISPPATIIAHGDTNAANADGYTYAIANGTPTTGTAETYVGLQKLTFTPVSNPAAVQTDFFTIRYIPMVKYIVNYANGASGSVSINLPNATTPSTLDTIALFNASGTNPPTQTGYVRRGQTTITISTTKGSYNEIQVRQLQQIGGAIVANTSTSKYEPDIGGPNSFSPFNYPTDNEWEILVIK